ncbi:MAG: NAD(+) synthase [Acutalibacteraceae bacterium]
MKDGYIKVAASSPLIRVGDCAYNAENIITEIQKANENGVKLIVFPELSITGYTCSDLFMHGALLDAAEEALLNIAKSTEKIDLIAVVGLPVRSGSSLYNCAAVLQQGKILGIVPKKNIPSYSEFYEMRHFTPGVQVVKTVIGGVEYEINPNVLFKCADIPDFVLGVEICEDLWVPSSPSVALAENGATVIVNLSASDEYIGKPKYRKTLVQMQSAKLVCGYIFADAGFGESTTDLIFSAHNLIYENGTLLSESKRYTANTIMSELDVNKLTGERRRMTTFPQKNDGYKDIYFSLTKAQTKLTRSVSKTPFVPYSKAEVQNRCEEILTMQATGLAARLKHTGIKSAVVGLSGGLDSTLALIVAVHAFNMLDIPLKNITAVTMPCFGTTKRTKSNAESLAQAYGVTFLEVDITDAVNQHFKDINHDPAVMDVTYENSQARERTQVLMDIANKNNALVIGTGDLSELALGWATYNGDHMSMYAVNASVPKTLVRYLTEYESKITDDKELKTVLLDILNTPVSPELLPPKNGEISQKTEELVGPYELHDFFLYYFVRFGFTPSKIYRLAKYAFKGEYDDSVIKKWLTVFVKRFFSQQFKRSCLPDAPKVGSVTLSPRGDFRMPSDASVKMWLNDLQNTD